MHKLLTIIISLLLIILNSSCSIDSIQNEFRIYSKHKEKKDYKSALISLNKIIKKTKKKKTIEKALLKKAKIYLNDFKDDKRLVEVYDKLANISSSKEKKIEFKLLVVDLYNKQEKYDLSILKLKEIKNNNSEIYIVEKKLAKIYILKKDYYQALLEINKYLKFPKEKIDYFKGMVIKSEILDKYKQKNKSILIYEDLVMNYPKASLKNDIHINLLNLYESEGMFKKAIKLIEEMIGLYPEKKSFLKSKHIRFSKSINQMPGAKGLRR